MARPGNELAAAESQGHGALLASDADREQVIGALEAAFVQGRLTRDELGARVDRVYASRTYAELPEVIADIPTALTGARSARHPWRMTKRAWWFEYAVYMPGLLAILFLPGGPSTTVWTFVFLASVLYMVFWALGVVIKVASRNPKPPREPQLPFCHPAGRDQVIHTLKAALAQGRLTEDEYDTRAAQASTTESRTELAALTADLPADLTARLPAARDAWTGLCVIIAAITVVAVILGWGPDNFPTFALGLLAAVLVLMAPPVTVGLMLDARYQKRAGGQLRLGPTHGAGG
jgi:Domain of unknown function (DUF1707)